MYISFNLQKIGCKSIQIPTFCKKQGCHKTWNPGKTWNLKNFEKKNWNFDQK